MQPEIPILILKTSDYENLWDKDGEAKYQEDYLKRFKEDLKKWKDDCPLPAIAFYIKKQSNKPPSFLSIEDITYEGKQVCFSFRLISQLPNITSLDFAKKLENNEKKGLFYTVDYDKINSVLDKLNIIPPEEWEKLPKIAHDADVSEPWKNWIGEHFLKIDPNINPDISYNDYEDMVAEIFIALGFKVNQMGHLMAKKEVPDGISKTEDLKNKFAIVYDAKNRKNFYPDSDEIRAMKQYVDKFIDDPFLKDIEKERIYFAYIARGYSSGINIGQIRNLIEVHSEGFLFTSEAMLRLLYWKIKLGPNFNLSKLKDLTSKNIINLKEIDEIYQDGTKIDK